jgi:predicted HAD superfamily Cof-like phosphohydrolase
MGRDALNRIEQFNIERGLLDGDNPFNGKLEHNMLKEELDEFEEALLNYDVTEAVDALCDIIVVATGSLLKLGFSPRLVLDETLKEIEDRTGAINTTTGKWQKVLRGDEYKANYGVCYND